MFNIVIPVYNPTRLKRALDSIEAQNMSEDIVVILVDDNSKDKSYQEILGNYTFDCRLIECDVNVGPGMARQIGLEQCQDDWVTFLDHDDEFVAGCFDRVKEYIEKTGCTLMLVSDTLIADSYDWIRTQNYQTSHNAAFLHGKFYNRQKLKEYSIHFSPELRAQEDTFFCAQIEGYIALDKNLGEQAKVYLPLITYCWYLWPDSTSHKMKDQISYLENTFDEYIMANYDAYRILYKQYRDEEFKCSKLVSLIDYCYWFYQSFKFFNPDGYRRENLGFIKELIKMAMQDLGIAYYEELMAILVSRPELYYLTFEMIKPSTQGPFIPEDSMGDFIRLCTG